ncbi:MAG: hypothetical protein HY044_00265 [Candidatus Woesebacteria bacterium]|nr:MAG: hypothetical protein HY044_00265 [Candidatus Woesebacteria bacterium]
MRLPKNVKVKPIFFQHTAQAIYPNIYVPKWLYEHLKSKNPDSERVAVIIHEQTHIKRQKEMGWFLWEIKYVFLPKFRLEEELLAIKAQVKYLKSKGIKYDEKDVEKAAKFLSSYLYLWMVSYKEAKRKLMEFVEI